MSEYLEKSLKSGKTYDQIVPIDVYSYKELLEKLKTEPTPSFTKTGIPLLDKTVGGFEPERLYVLSAMTKHGKTTLAQSIMFNMAVHGDASLFFSYEMSWKEVVKVYEGMQKAKNAKIDLPMFLPLDLHRGGGELQFNWLYEAIAKAKIERNIKFVVIDHLHFLLPLKDFNNTSFLIGGIVRELKRMAVSLQIPIMLIAHTQKLKDDKIPDWTDIRDSSFITQEADMVLMIYRIKEEKAARKITDVSTEDVYTNKAILSVELNRMGGQTKKIPLIHTGVMFEESTSMIDFGNDTRRLISKNEMNSRPFKGYVQK